jgi:ribonuclease H2 subunit A
VSKKADSLFPIVSAASIAAKVVRDFELKTWEYKEQTITASKQFGSGYPGGLFLDF